MKRIIYILLFLCLATTGALAQQVSGSFKAQPLSKVLETLAAQQSDYSVSFVHNQLEGISVTKDVKNKTLPEAIREICKGLPVKVTDKGNLVLVQAQETKVYVWGSVQDGFLKTPLTEAKVKLLEADSTTVIQDSVRVNAMKNSRGKITEAQIILTLPANHTYVFHATLDGYDDGWLAVNIPEPSGGAIFRADPIELRKTLSAKLDEVTVTATKVKMYYKGDTLVYNADAFKLPDGSMLDALIKQLPGVTMNEHGQIFVNGRMIDELLLGSRTFFRGNSKVLMENLPYYTVKDIKVYEQQSDRSIAAGFDVEPRKYVMDVNLKPEYNQGLIANAEVAAGTKDRYLARAFLLGFADPYRFTLLGNVNNVNESRQIGQSGHWTPASMPRSLLTTRSVAGEIDYQTEDKNVKDNFHFDFTSTEDESDMHQYRETFMNGSNPSSKLHSSSLAKAHSLNVRNEFTRVKPYYLNFKTGYSRNDYSGNAAALSEQFNDTLLTRMREEGFRDGQSWDADVYGFIQIPYTLKNTPGTISLHVDVKHNEDKSEEARKYEHEKTAANSQYNAKHFSHRVTTGDVGFRGHLKTKKLLFNLFAANFEFKNEHTHDHLYHPDTLLLPSQLEALQAITDRNNSYDSHYRELKGHLNLMIRPSESKYATVESLSIQYDYSPWELQFDFQSNDQSLDYHRGTLDTLAHRTEFTYSTDFSCHIFPSASYSKELVFRLVHYINGTSLFDRISYRDDATPLVVKLGNPNLKGSESTGADFDYYNRSGVYGLNSKNKLQYHFNAAFTYRHRDVAQSVSYNPNTGVYTYKPINVKGNYTATGAFDISRALDEKRYWTWQMNAKANYNHSIDHTMFEGETESHENEVNTLTLSDNTYIQFQKGDLNIRATGDIAWRHSEGRMRDFKTLNALDYQYGLSARYTLPVLKTTLTADGTMYSRRGYGSAMLNTDDFVVNASVSQPFLQGKLIARLEAFDLLHNLSPTQYEVNAQGRTETWYRSLPHYAMLHLVYHWNKNPKKR